MTTPICTIDATGIHRPSYAECQEYFREKYRAIYGQDIVFAPEDRDTQFLDLLALALHDVNGEVLAAYHSFDPGQAVGAGLSSLVHLNGIKRANFSHSFVDVALSGDVGTEINNGIVTDENENQWILPSLVVIPPEGQITVTATAAVGGNIRASVGSVRNIFTPVAGWQEVYNYSAATPGAPVEVDGLLRQRQSFSAALPALSSFDGLRAAIAAIPGVTRYQVYNNDHPGVDDLSIPGHSVAVVVEGGVGQTIADAIALKKGVGVGTHGTSSTQTTADAQGRSLEINYSVVRYVPVSYTLTVKALGGFTADILASIRSALADWTSEKAIGEKISLSDAWTIARLYGTADSRTFDIVPGTLKVARDGLVTAVQDISFAYDEVALCVDSYVNVTLT